MASINVHFSIYGQEMNISKLDETNHSLRFREREGHANVFLTMEQVCALADMLEQYLNDGEETTRTFKKENA